MLFNTLSFIGLFLPLTLCATWYAAVRGPTSLVPAVLLIASVVFYGAWNPVYLLLLGGSVAVNHALGEVLRRRRSRLLLGLGIAANLAVLGYFKYAGFFLDALNDLAGTAFAAGPIVLPLAISFFTFQQIAYLVDVWRGVAPQAGFTRYALFVTFFPQLLAGPIVRYGEVADQLARRMFGRFSADDFAAGLVQFVIGLAKKVLIADTLARVATPVFTAAELGLPIPPAEAWMAAAAYGFQLYFDFSGYSDMALGLGRMLGVRLPLNFDSPYKAASIIDFWRRWHMTLARFLRDYLYIPLGGNRRGTARRYANIMLVMLLGGLWHGAGWTFVLWGGLHGLYLLANHAWRAVTGRDRPASAAGRLGGGVLTFLAVTVAWVLFRAETPGGALALYASMAGAGAGTGSLLGADLALAALALPAAAALSWLAPNAQTIVGRLEARRFPYPTSALGAGALAALALIAITVGLQREFIYFQF